MITWQRVQGEGGVLVVRDRSTGRPGELDQLILAEGWGLRAGWQYGRLLLEVWGPAQLLPAPEAVDDGFTTISEAAAELGIPTGEVIRAMVDDGLLLSIDGELIASPHPDIRNATNN
ncbi:MULTISPECIES: hypothetical protein [Corynebacterium]|uniref:hypothetical protein n=1 Tax=Corynebacterium TaxID=1716 RepID=UPI0008A54343|nr:MULTISPECIES: hypothetical protein [Corynebacterium]OFT77008.1 hypothetical protein HMPREF3104_03630 [Corynebacterium sp. HMSC30G07]